MRNVELLRGLQWLFSKSYGLTIFFTDKTGEPVLEMTGNNDLCHLFKNDILLEVKQNISKNISKPLLFDIFPGMYIGVSPLQEKSDVFLWAGIFIEENSLSIVERSLMAECKHLNIKGILAKAPKISQSNKGDWLRKINQAGELAGVCIQESHGILYSQIIKASEYALGGDTPLSQLLAELFDSLPGIDYWGLAVPMTDDLYTVSTAEREAEHLQGAVFAQGEGFLGRALLERKKSYWENIDNDPRQGFFQHFDLQPRSLLCFPVKDKNGSNSLVFCGSCTSDAISESGRQMAEAAASLVEVALSVEQLKQENSEQLTRLTSLAEICHLLAAAPDLKKITYILVDISLNLVKGPFSVVIVKDAENKAQLVSRGDIGGDLLNYLKEAARKYFSGQVPADSEENIPRLHTASSHSVIECPLVYKDQVVGLLCVGSNNASENALKDYFSLLRTMAIVAGISVKQAKQEKDYDLAGKADTLHAAIEQFNPQGYIHSKEVAEMASGFSKALHLSSDVIENILYACRLSCYETDFLSLQFPGAPFVEVIKKGIKLKTSVREYWKESSVASQIYYLCDSFVVNGGNVTDSFLQATEIGEKFQLFIKETQLIEHEFSLEPDSKTENKSIASTLKNQTTLSPREQDVLDLVIRGFNNREIAQELYISEHTVKNHLTKVFQKLDVPDRAQAITRIYQLTYENNTSS